MQNDRRKKRPKLATVNYYNPVDNLIYLFNLKNIQNYLNNLQTMDEIIKTTPKNESKEKRGYWTLDPAFDIDPSVNLFYFKGIKPFLAI